MSFRSAVPATPRVISPSPTPSEAGDQANNFGPVTRSARKRLQEAQKPIDEGVGGIDEETEESDELDGARRARSRSRSPIRARTRQGLQLTSANGTAAGVRPKPQPLASNGTKKSLGSHLSPPQSASPGWSWRNFSRSPSPLGLIPIHRHWRVFVHRHEVPRKVLHVSIGFFTIWLYVSGIQTTAITPSLLGALIPIATVDYLRHTYPALNRVYARYLGAFMRETEYEGWNGVIWYLLGAWIVLGFFPKDVGVMGVLLLSWCDTAASTVGRAYGAYTPRIRKGKSLAGSLAAFAVGVVTAVGFWGWLAPKYGSVTDNAQFPFMFNGVLQLPSSLAGGDGKISGPLALGLVSLWTGLVASASEVVDIFGWDDNLTIPVLSGLGIWGFLKVFT